MLQRVCVVAKIGHPFDDDEGKRWRVVVHTQADARIVADVGRLDGGMPSGKEDRVAVHGKPDRSDMGPPISTDRGKFGGAGTLHQKGRCFSSG
jgi:hypothetical protein